MSLPKRPAEQPSTAEPGTQPVIISHAEMNRAFDQGLVSPLGQTIAYVVRYQDTWWIHFEKGWVRSDNKLADMLDAEAARITAQDTIVARKAAIRAATRPDPEQRSNPT
ncbi:hypothetical protein ACGFIV_24560 [Sphaerisporangium sp. NPDC049003]|uniref:hypothetical protein n=1 Tax=Sphaerisporangium sp. NPDC049003 TaxID=3364517 RepID=UPI0037120AFC